MVLCWLLRVSTVKYYSVCCWVMELLLIETWNKWAITLSYVTIARILLHNKWLITLVYLETAHMWRCNNVFIHTPTGVPFNYHWCLVHHDNRKSHSVWHDSINDFLISPDVLIFEPCTQRQIADAQTIYVSRYYIALSRNMVHVSLNTLINYNISIDGNGNLIWQCLYRWLIFWTPCIRCLTKSLTSMMSTR